MGDSTDRYARAYRYAFPLPFKAMDEKTNASLSLVKYCRLSTGLESEGDTTIECYATKSSFAALGLEGGSWGWISKASMHGDWPTASEKGRCHIVKLVAEQGVDSLPDKGCSGSAAQPPSESSSTLFARSGRQKGKSEEPRVFLSASLMHFLQLTSGKSFVSIRPFVPRPGARQAYGDVHDLPQVSRCVIRPISTPSDNAQPNIATEAIADFDDWQSTLLEYFAVPRILAEGQVCAVLSSSVLRRNVVELSHVDEASEGVTDRDVSPETSTGYNDTKTSANVSKRSLGRSLLHSQAEGASVPMCPGRCCLGLTNSAPGVGSLSTSFSPLFTYETLRKLPPDSKFSSSISASPDRASSPTVGDELSLHNEKSAVSIPRTRHKSAKSALKQDTQISNSSVEDPCGKQDESAARWRGGTDERVPLPTDQGFAARLAANALANVRGCPGGQDALSSLSGNLFLAPEWERKVQHCLRWFYVEYIELGTQDLDVPASGVRTVLPPPVGVVSRQSTGLFLQGRTTSRRLIPFGAHHCLRCPPSPVLPAIQEPLARFLSFATFLLNQSSTSTEGRSERAAILLKGPRGSGKRTLARHACQQLGFHFKEIDGLALSQGASGTAAAAGSAAIHVDGSIAPGTNSRFSAALVEAASEATPVLIYIRRMHMLYRYVGGDAPIGADMHRLQARLASHLRWFLTAHGRWLDRHRGGSSPTGTALHQTQADSDFCDKIVLVVASLETETDETSEGSGGDAQADSPILHEFLETFDLVIPLKRPDKASLELVARELIEAIHSTDETCSSPILQVSPTEVAEICTGLSAAEVHSLFHRVLHDKVAALSQAQSPAATGAIHPQETCKIPPIETMTATGEK